MVKIIRIYVSLKPLKLINWIINKSFWDYYVYFCIILIFINYTIIFTLKFTINIYYGTWYRTWKTWIIYIF